MGDSFFINCINYVIKGFNKFCYTDKNILIKSKEPNKNNISMKPKCIIFGYHNSVSFTA